MKKYQFVLMKKSFLDNLKIFFLFMAILVTLYLFLLDNKNLDKNYLYQTVLGYQTLFKFDNLAFLFKIYNLSFIFLTTYKFINFDLQSMRNEILLREHRYRFFISKISYSIILLLLYRIFTNFILWYLSYITLNTQINFLSNFINDFLFTIISTWLCTLLILDNKNQIIFSFFLVILPFLAIIFNNKVLYFLSFIDLFIFTLFKLINFNLKRMTDESSITFF